MEISKDLFTLYEECVPIAVFWHLYLSMIQTLRDYAKSIKTFSANFQVNNRLSKDTNKTIL